MKEVGPFSLNLHSPPLKRSLPHSISIGSGPCPFRLFHLASFILHSSKKRDPSSLLLIVSLSFSSCQMNTSHLVSTPCDSPPAYRVDGSEPPRVGVCLHRPAWRRADQEEPGWQRQHTWSHPGPSCPHPTQFFDEVWEKSVVVTTGVGRGSWSQIGGGQG